MSIQIVIYDMQEFSRTVSEAEGTTVRCWHESCPLSPPVLHVGRKFSAGQGCLFVEASAKTSVGVRETFLEVVEKVRLHSNCQLIHPAARINDLVYPRFLIPQSCGIPPRRRRQERPQDHGLCPAISLSQTQTVLLKRTAVHVPVELHEHLRGQSRTIRRGWCYLHKALRVYPDSCRTYPSYLICYIYTHEII